MDNRGETTEYQAFLLELIQLINREPRRQERTAPASRNHFNHGTSHNRYQSGESIYRQQVYELITQYSRNVLEYQHNMRDYNDIVYYALEMLESMRPNRNANPSAHGQHNTRNYLSSSAGFRGRFNTDTFRGLFNTNPVNLTPRTTPFANIFSEPVIIRPTNQQINIATRTLQYSTDLSNNTRCPITLE